MDASGTANLTFQLSILLLLFPIFTLYFIILHNEKTLKSD